MNTRTLSTIAKLHGKRPSDLARAAHVSRAAVSFWLARPVADVKDRHVQKLAASLGVPMDVLMGALPLLSDRDQVKTLEASLLWDGIYNSIEDFAVALARGDLRAIARLVEVRGMFTAAKIVGRSVWTRFKSLKTHIHPVRRRECEALWRELRNLKLI